MSDLYCPKCNNRNGLVSCIGTLPAMGTFDCSRQEMVALKVTHNELDCASYQCMMCGSNFTESDLPMSEEAQG